jgi:hypothetical protein
MRRLLAGVGLIAVVGLTVAFGFFALLYQPLLIWMAAALSAILYYGQVVLAKAPLLSPLVLSAALATAAFVSSGMWLGALSGGPVFAYAFAWAAIYAGLTVGLLMLGGWMLRAAVER